MIDRFFIQGESGDACGPLALSCNLNQKFN